MPLGRGGIVDACTGVIFEKPIVAVASIIHCERGVDKASHDRDDAFADELLCLGPCVYQLVEHRSTRTLACSHRPHAIYIGDEYVVYLSDPINTTRDLAVAHSIRILRTGRWLTLRAQSLGKQRTKSPQPDTIAEEKSKDEGESSDSSLEKRARTRSRSPILTPADGVLNGKPRRRLSGLTTRTSAGVIKKSEPLPTKHTNGNALPPQVNGHLSPYSYSSQIKKSWREFSRSPSPLGLIPLHRHYRTLIHKHEIPRKALHVSIGFLTLQFYTRGLQTPAITPVASGAIHPDCFCRLAPSSFPFLQ
ncbi:hypothetical protein MRB53_039668 [Persea americana]|nr:hypothetical protein MRB53_039668 [Persea americana]